MDVGLSLGLLVLGIYDWLYVHNFVYHYAISFFNIGDGLLVVVDFVFSIHF